MFGFLNFTKECSNTLQVRWKSLRCIRREFSCKSIGERILKTGPYLPKLLSNIKGLTVLRHSVYLYETPMLAFKQPQTSFLAITGQYTGDITRLIQNINHWTRSPLLVKLSVIVGHAHTQSVLGGVDWISCEDVGWQSVPLCSSSYVLCTV